MKTYSIKLQLTRAELDVLLSVIEGQFTGLFWSAQPTRSEALIDAALLLKPHETSYDIIQLATPYRALVAQWPEVGTKIAMARGPEEQAAFGRRWLKEKARGA